MSIRDVNDLNQIGARIKKHRKLLGLTQEQLSEMINVSTNFLGDVERGIKRMSTKTLLVTANVLHVSLDYLVYGKSMYVVREDGVDYSVDQAIERGHIVYELLDCLTDEEKDTITDIVKILIPKLNALHQANMKKE